MIKHGCLSLTTFSGITWVIKVVETCIFYTKKKVHSIYKKKYRKERKKHINTRITQVFDTDI